jgi:hypothetical protein
MNRLSGLLVLAAIACLLPSCESGGHFTIFGYTTQPNYDTCIKTVYVPIFNNEVITDSVRRGIEVDLTKAVVREIELKTPYKVVSDRCRADTELIGRVVNLNKDVLNRNPLNEIREGQTTLTVEITWRDLRTGEILSRPRPAGAVMTAIPGQPAPEVLIPGAVATPTVPAPGAVAGATLPAPVGIGGKPGELGGPSGTGAVLVQSTGTFIPEIGQSEMTSLQQNVNRMAVQIVSLMEKPW